MLIRELSRDECLDVLSRTRMARLACVRDGQPYIVPVHLAYDSGMPDFASLYGVTTLGTKVEWMRANPRVCVEMDEITEFDEWVSVVALGRYEELEDQSRGEESLQQVLRRPMVSGSERIIPDSQGRSRLKAYEILQGNATPMWWEPASSAWASRSEHKSGDSYVPLYYRVCVEQISGRRASSGERGVDEFCPKDVDGGSR
ncbi:pyridoxamine 5'-phosphate oxidase family protein [Singulisphaera sp. PoT]|uniref:pyridoxamine 5'-phosphate oxidase family protein n=1 Tax=Singulisphaera sp. PoT TaxID=3411797 RepID=UPI003BF60764